MLGFYLVLIYLFIYFLFIYYPFLLKTFSYFFNYLEFSFFHIFVCVFSVVLFLIYVKLVYSDPGEQKQKLSINVFIYFLSFFFIHIYVLILCQQWEELIKKGSNVNICHTCNVSFYSLSNEFISYMFLLL